MSTNPPTTVPTTASATRSTSVSIQLPTPLTGFVGRSAELAEIAALLAAERLLTLTGPGGAGKTRLALRLAAEAAEDFPDGVWFVDLAPLTGDQFVWDQIATALAVKEPGPGRVVADAVGRYLAARRGLVVLDNCEHVVAAAAEAASGLLTAAPAVKVLATSREPLGVGGEVTWAVPPLREPDGVALFAARAHAARPRMRLGEEDAQAVRVICRRLDGLPLAIELAAARTRALAPARIAAHLGDHLRPLPIGPRTAPARQATLRASFEWSCGLLSVAEQVLLRQLSVFAGGFDLEAALAVCPAASIELLAALTDRSLLVIDDRDGGAEPRYRMLETIREFATELLAKAGEVELLRARHRDHYLRLAEAVGPQLHGPDQVCLMARLRTDQDNLRAALAWSRDQGDAAALAGTVVALSQFWAGQGRFIEYQMWLDAAAERAEELPARLRAWIRLMQCLRPALGAGSLGQVRDRANEALALARASGDKHDEGLALAALGMVAGLTGGAEAMRPYVEQALPLLRSDGPPRGFVPAQPMLSVCLGLFAILRWFQSDPEESRRLAEEAVAVTKARGDIHFLLAAIWVAGMTDLIQGRLDDAAQLFETAVADGREADDTVVWSGLLGLAWVSLLRGDYAATRAAVAEARAAAQGSDVEAGSVRTVEPISRWVLGCLHLASGDPARGREALAAVVHVVRSSRLPLISRYAALPLITLAEAQLALGLLDDAAASLEEATALARSGALTWALGRAGQVRAELCAHQGDLREAESLAHDALSLAREAGDQLGLVDGLELLARLTADQESPREAVRLWAAAGAQREQLGYARFPADRPAHDAAVARASQALGAEAFAAAWADGAELCLEAAVAYAARGRGERRRPTAGWASLTPTELEVARLVGQHLTNPEIASRLFVSRATVKTHLVHIFAKLGIDSRSRLAAEAISRGIAQ